MAKPHGQKEIPCRLLFLPPELRLQIYGHVFSSTRLTHGQRFVSYVLGYIKRMKPAPNSLALLRSCRLTNQDIGDSWLGQVSFAFERIDDMLDKLSPLPRSLLKLIRRIRVGSRSIKLSLPGQPYVTGFPLVWALKLLPGLCLETLTVIDDMGGLRAYETLNGLVKHGDGWRELHYITGDSTMLTFQNRPYFLSGNRNWRKPQPSTWTRELAQRDGVDSGVSVKIYRSTKLRTLCSVINPNARETFEQKPPSGEALDSFGFEIDPFSHPDQVRKEVLVIIRRGKHAHNVENVTVPLPEQDIRQWSGGMDWEGIKRASCLDQLRYIIPVHPELEDIVGTDSDDDADDYSSMTSYALKFG